MMVSHPCSDIHNLLKRVKVHHLYQISLQKQSKFNMTMQKAMQSVSLQMVFNSQKILHSIQIM